DVFVRDVVGGVSELISARDAALPSLSPNGSSLLSTFSVSTNGQYLAFASDADNLVPNATNGSTSGDGPSTDSAISGDGRYVAFTSSADNLVAGDNNKAQDVFVRDTQ